MSGEISGGEYLRRIRKNKGFSQTDVFEKTGITDSRLSRIESGKEAPAKTLCQLAMLYDIDILDLLKRFGYIDEPYLMKRNRLKHVESLTTDQINAVQQVICSYLVNTLEG